MAERKVLNKYYSPDFDPSLVKKRCSLKGKVFISRMMLPMTLRCITCGSYSMIGTKFNMKTLRAPELKYLSIPIWRFHFKCQACYSWITFRTDPKNTDYVCESGAVRNYEADKDFKAAEDSIKAMREEEEFGDAMKGLENRTGDSKREMEILEAIDEIEEINKRQVSITADQIVEKITKQDKIQEEDLTYIENFYTMLKKKRDEEEQSQNAEMINRVDAQGFQAPHPKKKQEEKVEKKIKLNVRVKPKEAENTIEHIEKKIKLDEVEKDTSNKEVQEKSNKQMNKLLDYSDDSDEDQQVQ